MSSTLVQRVQLGRKGKPVSSVFSDKSSLILRAMLRDPGREWVVRDFVRMFDLGQGRTAEVLRLLRRHGFLEGIATGRAASGTLRNRKELVAEWTRHYHAALNRFHLGYTHRTTILQELVNYFRARGLEENYALTLHTGANLKTHYVADPNVYLYLGVPDFEKEYLALRERLDLKELRQGGNVYLIEPYYKHSVFFDARRIRGLRVVSDLQLYLDLHNFQPRGPEHAEHLLKVLKEQGECFV